MKTLSFVTGYKECHVLPSMLKTCQHGRVVAGKLCRRNRDAGREVMKYGRDAQEVEDNRGMYRKTAR